MDLFQKVSKFAFNSWRAWFGISSRNESCHQFCPTDALIARFAAWEFQPFRSGPPVEQNPCGDMISLCSRRGAAAVNAPRIIENLSMPSSHLFTNPRNSP